MTLNVSLDPGLVNLEFCEVPALRAFENALFSQDMRLLEEDVRSRGELIPGIGDLLGSKIEGLLGALGEVVVALFRGPVLVEDGQKSYDLLIHRVLADVLLFNEITCKASFAEGMVPWKQNGNPFDAIVGLVARRTLAHLEQSLNHLLSNIGLFALGRPLGYSD